MKTIKHDDASLKEKVALRRRLLAFLSNPLILETHGGRGLIWQRLYRDLSFGIVLEKDSKRAAGLARQRPTWAVYEGDSLRILAAGLAAHLPVNFLDVDPYGAAWPVLDAFFIADRVWPNSLVLAVHDGFRLKAIWGQAWHCRFAAAAVYRFGNDDLYGHYLDACRFVVDALAASRGYEVYRWVGYHCGFHNNMTHYGAVLCR